MFTSFFGSKSFGTYETLEEAISSISWIRSNAPYDESSKFTILDTVRDIEIVVLPPLIKPKALRFTNPSIEVEP